MSTVAPSAPAPAVADGAASGTGGQHADPAAFAAEFETALTTLASATAAPAAPDAPTAELPALPAPAEALPAPVPPITATAPVPGAAPAPAPVPGTAAYEMQDGTAPPAGETAVLPAPAVDDSCISDIGGVTEGASIPALAGAVPAADGDEDAASPDAPAPVSAAPAGPVPPVPVAPQIVAPPPAARAETGSAPAPAVDATAATAAPDGAEPAAPPAPVVAPAATALRAPDEVAAPAAPSRAQAPDLVGQLSRPLHGLRSFGDGTHIITIRVNPDNLGPVAVRAHVSGESMRIELVAPTEVAREAIKAILPDLRRDLSGAGGQATLDLSSGNQPSGRESAQRDAPLPGGRRDVAAPAPATGIRTTTRTDVGLDVLA